MAHPERFELPTYGSVIRCSIQLSYGCAKNLREEGILGQPPSRGKPPQAHGTPRPQDPKTPRPELFRPLHLQRPTQKRPLVGDLLDLHPGGFAGAVAGPGLHSDENRSVTALSML